MLFCNYLQIQKLLREASTTVELSCHPYGMKDILQKKEAHLQPFLACFLCSKDHNCTLTNNFGDPFRLNFSRIFIRISHLLIFDTLQ